MPPEKYAPIVRPECSSILCKRITPISRAYGFEVNETKKKLKRERIPRANKFIAQSVEL